MGMMLGKLNMANAKYIGGIALKESQKWGRAKNYKSLADCR